MRITFSTKPIYNEVQVYDILDYYNRIINCIDELQEKKVDKIYLDDYYKIIARARNVDLHKFLQGKEKIKELEKILDEIEVKYKVGEK